MLLPTYHEYSSSLEDERLFTSNISTSSSDTWWTLLLLLLQLLFWFWWLLMLADPLWLILLSTSPLLSFCLLLRSSFWSSSFFTSSWSLRTSAWGSTKEESWGLAASFFDTLFIFSRKEVKEKKRYFGKYSFLLHPPNPLQYLFYGVSNKAVGEMEEK